MVKNKFIENFIEFTCIPTTAKINIIIPRINVKFPKAPIDLPIIEIRRFNVCHDLANLNTRNLTEYLKKTKNSIIITY